MITDKQLAEWQAACDAATEGPWAADDADGSICAQVPGDDDWETIIFASSRWGQGPDDFDEHLGESIVFVGDGDAEFIAIARTALPEAIAEIRRRQDAARRILERVSGGDFPQLTYVGRQYTIADLIRDLKEIA